MFKNLQYITTLVILSIGLLVTVGCTPSKSKIDYTPLISIELAVQSSIADTNTPVNKVPRSECTHCHGKGKIRTGDGIAWEECPYCVADNDEGQGGNFTAKPEDTSSAPPIDKENLVKFVGTLEPPTPTSAEIFASKKLKWKTLNGRCCPECKCDPCNCMFRGECIMREQAEKVGVVWHGDQGFVYYAPHGDNLATYDKIWRASANSSNIPSAVKSTPQNQFYSRPIRRGYSSCGPGGCH